MIPGYDFNLSYENQTQEVKDFCNQNIFNKTPEIEFEPDTYRVQKYIFPYDSECRMVREEFYSEPYPSCLLDHEETKIELL